MKTRRDDFDLETELRALRPSPRAAFTDELDARLAIGFQPPDRQDANLFVRFGGALRAISPRRIALPAAAIALTAIVVATAVVAIDQPTHEASTARRLGDLGQITNTSEPSRHHSQSAGEGGTGRQSGLPYSVAPSTASGEQLGKLSSDGASAPAAGLEFQSAAAPMPRSTTGPFATNASHRDVERSAEMVLGADPAAVHSDAAKVFNAVHAVDGIVLSSSIRDGGGGEAGARFDLLIPAAKLGDALASFSRIDEVRSRHEATQDITAPTVGVGERLNDSQARIDGLLTQLTQAETAGERSSVETELSAERRHRAGLRARLAELSRRAHLSRVSLRIDTGSTGMGSSAARGSWGVSEALGDAGHILSTAAAVAVIGIALVAPLAAIVLLAWLANRAWVRHRRESALG